MPAGVGRHLALGVHVAQLHAVAAGGADVVQSDLIQQGALFQQQS